MRYDQFMKNLNPRVPSRGLVVGSSEGFRRATICRPLCCSLRVHARSAAAALPVAPLDSGPSSRRHSGWTDFKATLADLRRHCPAALPVVVRMAGLADTILGECVRRRKRFVVRLNHSMGENQAIDVLLHEWGHALAWNYSLDRLSRTPGIDPAEFEQASHDEAWGCAYARVWRAHLEALREAE